MATETQTAGLTSIQTDAIIRIVRACIDQGAACQRMKSFVAAEPGEPLRSIYDVMTERALRLMEAIHD
jgi:hypothetical protein